MSITTTLVAPSPLTMELRLFPAPPPTNNSLDPEERSRLLRSTRKLGAVLGETPFLLESETDYNRPPKASRREGRIFGHSPSSSVSSMDTSEPDYVLVKSSAQSAPYQVQSLSNESATRQPNSNSSSRKRKGADSALPPIALVFDIPGSRSGAGNKGPSQPLLLRMRPALARRPTDSSIKSSSNHDQSAKPLSPTAATFNMDVTTDAHVLSDSEKRRKMAKLTRTLGENIPPELVFRPPPRRSSISVRPRAEHLASFQKPSVFVPITAPAPRAADITPPPLPRAANTEQPKKTATRTRSLTRSSSAVAAPSRGTTSLDVQARIPETPFAFVDVLPAVPQSHIQTHIPEQPMEFGRRKEREWSGEWNLKDMDDVAKKLRGLKGR